MNWLTRSDIAGLPKASNPLVDETIKRAAHDTPEVTQVGGGLGQGGVGFAAPGAAPSPATLR